ncbi:MAG: type II toxin-antitoxin system RatA family toxin [Aeromonas sp.]
MGVVCRKTLVMFSAEQMYALVNDVAAYPQFLPGCVASAVTEQSAQSMLASVTVGRLGLVQCFTTRNSLIAGREIRMALVEGPFRQLSGCWRFTPLDSEACEVALDLQFEFSSPLMAQWFGAIFHEVVGAMVSAFSTRAKEVYGG